MSSLKPLSTNQLMKQIIEEFPDIDIYRVHVFFLPGKELTRYFRKESNATYYFNPVAILMKTSDGNKKYDKLPPIYFKQARKRHPLNEHDVNTLEILNEEKFYRGFSYYTCSVRYIDAQKPIYDKLYKQHRNDPAFKFERPKHSKEADEEDYDDSLI